MDRRRFLKQTGKMVVGLGTWGVASAASAAAKRPNIMIVIGDDMTWFDCEPYGNGDVRTPNMARLAREGMCFDAMFTSTAMCAPTRQQLYTGMYPLRSGAYPNHSRVYDGVKSLPLYLKKLGYRVGLIGKTHFGPAASYPFEHLAATLDKGDRADVDSISEFVNGDKNQPYCLVVCSNEPHGPHDKGDTSVYKADELTVHPYYVDCPETREALTKYYAEITHLDGELGDCMGVVERSGQMENTIVVFTSEQGAHFPFGGKWTCYENGLKTAFIVRWPGRVKAGSRTQAMAQYVDVTPTLIDAVGGDPEAIETGRDDALGKKGFDGRSFLGVLLGAEYEHRDAVFGAHTTRGIINGSACYPIRSVRTRRFKYIRNLNHESVFYNVVATSPDGLLRAWKRLGKNDPAIAARARMYQYRPAEEVYDIQADPYELKNLADDPAYADVKEQLRAKLDEWMKQQGDGGVAAEMNAIARQGPNRKWTPYDPAREAQKKVRSEKKQR